MQRFFGRGSGEAMLVCYLFVTGSKPISCFTEISYYCVQGQAFYYEGRAPCPSYSLES